MLKPFETKTHYLIKNFELKITKPFVNLFNYNSPISASVPFYLTLGFISFIYRFKI